MSENTNEHNIEPKPVDLPSGQKVIPDPFYIIKDRESGADTEHNHAKA